MLKYIVKRIGMALATLLVIIFVLFVLVRIMPGNPFPSERMSATQIANKRAEMGLEDPILLQFVRYMKNVLRGDFGQFLSHRRAGNPDRHGLRAPAGRLRGAAPGQVSGWLLHRVFHCGRVRALVCISDLPAI